LELYYDMKLFKDRRERARHRAAAGRSIARLIERGLLECPGRGRWKLTPAGLALAQKLDPDVQGQLKEK
jgi:hypothetical protein